MKKILLIISFLFINQHLLYATENTIFLKYKINEDLITNYDILKESKYLTALNQEINGISQEQLFEFSKNSLIREKVKLYEIEKFYQVNYSSSSVESYIDDFMKKLNINNRSDFQIYLSSYETSIEEIKKKLIIEMSWNKMILEIYENRILIDKEKISKTLDDLIMKKQNQKSFELYEIVFTEKNKEDFKNTYEKIILDIENLGFEKAAIIYSISNTASSGGRIGWVNQNQLSKSFNEELKFLNVGDYTKPINTAGGSIILQLKNEKEVSIKNIDKELELSKIISAEKNRQLNEFSIIHYKKTENKAYVKEF